MNGAPGTATQRDLFPTILEAVVLSTVMISAVFVAQWRYGFNWADEGSLWYISQRTALGMVPIRDVPSYDPARFYWSATVFKLLGRDGLFEQVVADYLFGFVGLALAYIALARTNVKRSWRILLLLLLGIELGFPRHKIFEQALTLISAAGITFILLRPERPSRWFGYGVATGLAAFFGRNSGVYFVVAALMAMALTTGRRANLRLVFAAFAIGIVGGYSPMLALIFFTKGFAAAFVTSVGFTFKWTTRIPIPFPWAAHPHLYGLDKIQMEAASWLCVAVPAAYAAIIWKAARNWWGGAQTAAVGASVAGIPFIFHAFYRGDFTHLAQGLVPFALAVGAASYYLWTLGRRRWSAACLLPMMALVLASWLPEEPLVQHLRAKASAPQSVARVNIDGRDFEVPAEQAEVMNTVASAFHNCGSVDGSFLAVPFYPGMYPFLRTRAPSWDIYYTWPRGDEIQQREINDLIQNHTSLVLLNRTASFDGDTMRIDRTNPKLLLYLDAHYRPTSTKLPPGYELDALPGSCPQNFSN
jgi:hypothetical protein